MTDDDGIDLTPPEARALAYLLIARTLDDAVAAARIIGGES
jgi:hypothetical protein